MTRPSLDTHVEPSRRPAAARRVPLAWPLTLALAAAIVALSAQVAVPVPFSPVPMTLQGLAVLLVGGLFGSAIGAGGLVLYLIAGALGVPVFAGGAAGLARLFGPTGGYLLAFPVAAVIVGRLAERGQFRKCFFAALCGMFIIHLGGWAQLTVITGAPGRALQLGLVPFLPLDLFKVALAAVILYRGHHAFRLRA